MDIYEVELSEGRRLIEEIDKLRRKKNNGRIVVKCERINNEEIKRFRSSYLLNQGLTDIFAKTKQYFIIIEENQLSVSLVFSECNIVYRLRAENNWKIIEVEIIDSGLYTDDKPNHTEILGRAEVAAALVITQFSNTYGYSNVFDSSIPSNLARMFRLVMDNEALSEYEFGLEEKILTIISKNGLKKDFVDKYVINLQGETKK